jgi:hypothetical protein
MSERDEGIKETVMMMEINLYLMKNNEKIYMMCYLCGG